MTGRFYLIAAGLLGLAVPSGGALAQSNDAAGAVLGEVLKNRDIGLLPGEREAAKAAAAESAKRADADARTWELVGLSSDATRAKGLFGQQRWADAEPLARASCAKGNMPIGCMVLGKLLNEGRVGPRDSAAAIAAHQRAAAAFPDWCSASVRSVNNCLAAGEFWSTEALGGLRDAAQGRLYFSRALTKMADDCRRSVSYCREAGELASTNQAGPAQPALARELWQIGCEGELSGYQDSQACAALQAAKGN